MFLYKDGLSVQMGLLYFPHQADAVEHLGHVVDAERCRRVPHGAVRHARSLWHQVERVVTVLDALRAGVEMIIMLRV